jgi:hypothetical protein
MSGSICRARFAFPSGPISQASPKGVAQLAERQYLSSLAFPARLPAGAHGGSCSSTIDLRQ